MDNSARESSWSLKSIQIGTLITSLVLFAGSLFFRSVPLTVGVVAGSALASINFTLLHKITTMMTAGTPARGVVPGVLIAIKFFVGAAAVFGLLYYRQVDPIGLIVGLSSIVITLTFMSLVNYFTVNP